MSLSSDHDGELLIQTPLTPFFMIGSKSEGVFPLNAWPLVIIILVDPFGSDCGFLVG